MTRTDTRADEPPRNRWRLPRGLPHLQGWRGSAAQAVFSVLAALTFVQIVGSTWFNARDLFVNVPAAASFGFRTYSRQGAVPVIGEALTAEARASGLPAGALFVAIDGKLVPVGASEFTIGNRLSSDPDGRLLLVLKAEDGTVSRHRLTRNADYWTMIEPRSGLPIWLFSTFTVVMFQLPLLILFGIALALVGRRSRDPEALLIAFGMLLFCFTPSAGFWLAVNFGITHAVSQTAMFGAFTISLIALAGFPDGRFTTRLARVTVAGLLLVLSTGLTEFIWTPSRIRSIALNTGAIALSAMALAAMVIRYRASAGGERQQVKWAMLGFGAGTTMILAGAIGELSGLLGPGRGTLTFVLGLSLFSVGQVLGPIGLLVSLLRYRLYDAESAISRSVAYAGLTVALVAIFAASEKLIELTSEQYFGGQLGAVAGGFGAALAAVMIAPLHHRINHWAEHRFQKKLIRLRRGLPLLVGDLRETATLPALAEAAIDRVAAGVPATRLAIVVDDVTVAARGDAGELPVIVPLAADGVGEVGQLRLGLRPDGSLYGKDEREALDEVADPLARAIAIVRRRDADSVVRAKETRDLSDRIGRLEEAIGRLTGPGLAAGG